MKTSLKIFGALFLFSLLSVGLVSATPLEELMSNDATGITISMSQEETVNNFYVNTEGLSFDNFEIAFDGAEMSGSLSQILSEINLRVDLMDGENSPVFSNVVLSSFWTSLLNKYTDAGFNGNAVHNAELLNELTEDSLPVSMQGNVYFIKSGINYETGYDSGFGDIPEEYKNEIENAIIQGVNSLNVKDLLEENVLPFVDFDEVLPVMQSLDYEVTEVEFDEAIALVLDNMNYNIDVDLTSVSFQDGTYQIPVTITPLSGGAAIQKTVTLVLNGIINEENNQNSDNAGKYVPDSFGVKEILSSITGLLPNTVVSVQITGVGIQPAGVSTLSNANTLNYLIINVDQQPGANGAQIHFAVDRTKVSDTSKVSLYIWENGAWTKLPTTLEGITAEDYLFVATTPHFSTFMIGEAITPSEGKKRSTSGSGSANTLEEDDGAVLIGTGSDLEEAEPAPIDLSDENNGAAITGAAIGNFLKSGVGISLIAGVLVAVGAFSLVSFNKRKKTAVAEKKE